jgi:tripartite-type tricarboxylate transporter receptor subunit TctC
VAVRFIDDATVGRRLDFPRLIARLAAAFRADSVAPLRHHHQIAVPDSAAGTLLLMPAWTVGGPLAIKLVTVFPDNQRRSLPTVLASVMMLSAETGAPLALVAGRALTVRRYSSRSAARSRIWPPPSSRMMARTRPNARLKGSDPPHGGRGGRMMMRFMGLAILLLAAGASASADTYPSRPARILVPFTAGGATDIVARIMAQKLSERLGQQFVVENRPGASGNIAIAIVAKAPPDGYTLLATSSVFVVNPSLYAKHVTWDPFKDFVAISCVGGSPNSLLINPAVPATTVLGLIDWIRANPGSKSFATPGNGTTPHLAGELFRLAYQLDLISVPFGGAAPALQSLMQGQTPLAFMTLSNATELIRAGNVRLLAVTSAKRSPAMPDAPTMAEAGVPDQESDTLQFVLAPAGTPPAIIALLHREIVRLAALPEIQAQFASLGFDPLANTPDEAAAQIKREIAKWAKVIHDAGIKVE